ncbi:glycoside hydrolase family 78 protein [Paenibacillus cisolokensis]|uniref:family 78 glycoside hydrolase catalytic domain n=1 Tax=Paenibacillus cisolokensis TaxID=1658519 RepID=UPI003D2CCAC9
MLNVIDPRCEYRRNPIGIGERRPRISWRLQGDRRDVLQTAYRIQVSLDDAFRQIVWDSGKVESDASTHIELDGLSVKSRTVYYYRIQAWDNGGETSDWSETAWWETGLLDYREWQAQWIAYPEAHLAALGEACPIFRRTFDVRDGVVSARIYATAHGVYELQLDGRRVGDWYMTPGWTSYNKRLQYQTYDVTERMTPGKHAIGIGVGNGWYKGNLAWSDRRNIYGDRSAALLQLHLVYADGSEEMIVTDSEWRAAPSAVLMSEIYHGETYDASLEQPGWCLPDFDDSSWLAAETVEFDKSRLTAQYNEPVRPIETIKPIALLRTPAGETVLDMGQNMVGWIRFTVRAEAGREMRLQHAEVLDAEGNFYTENLRNAKQTITYRAKGGETETYEPHYTFQGFRYVKLEGFPEPVEPEQFTGVVIHSDMTPTGRFACSEPLVNQLHHNILWGLKGNFVDVPTDCPQRDERLGWTGDAQMFARTATYLMNVAPFFGKWLQDLAADQLEDGGVPFVIPNVLSEKEHSSSAWGDAAVIIPWTLYLVYGDKRILERQYDSMTAWIQYIRKQSGDEALWNTGFHFGDWLALDSKPGSYFGATDNDFIATAFYAYSVSLLRDAAIALGKTADAEELRALHERIVAAFRREFVTPAGRLAVPTQTAHVLALTFGLVEGDDRKRIGERLAKLVEDAGHLTTGFVGTPYLNHALSTAGHHEIASRLLLRTEYPSWLYQVTKGATTVWEHWDGIREDGTFWSKDMNSFNHYAYGSIGDWLYRVVAGIDTDPSAPGYKRIVLRPQPVAGLTWADGAFDSMYGEIRCAWKLPDKPDGEIEVTVTVPPNTTATLTLPDSASLTPDAVTESGTPLDRAAGVHGVRRGDAGLELKIGSGTYRFAYTASAAAAAVPASQA